MSEQDSHGWVIPDRSDESASARRERMEILAEWELLPRSARLELGLPATQSELAEMMGFSVGALSHWKKTPQFQRIMAARIRSHYGAERLAQVIDNLHRIALGDTPQAVSAARELIRYVEVTETVDPTAEVEGLTDEELFALAEAVERRRGASSKSPSMGVSTR